jgi:hypothetical protein
MEETEDPEAGMGGHARFPYVFEMKDATGKRGVPTLAMIGVRESITRAGRPSRTRTP